MSFGFNPDKSDVLNTSGSTAEVTVGTSAVALRVGGSNLADRQQIILQPKDNNIFIGYTSGVTTTTGLKLFKDQTVILPIGDQVTVWAISNGSGRLIIVQELA